MVDKAEEVGAGVLGIGKQLCQLDLLVAILTNQKHLIIDALSNHKVVKRC